MNIHRTRKAAVKKGRPRKRVVYSSGPELLNQYPKALSSDGAKVFLVLLECGKLTEKGVERKLNKLEFKERVLSYHPELLKTKAGRRFIVSAIRTSSTPLEFEKKVKKIESQKIKFDKVIRESAKSNEKYYPIMAGKK
ncbi:TPA: hypothetical protein MAK57_003362 [Klebsiella aerogenes]|nr:hypothetical protein [Klebsiella aerogenes]